MKEEERFLRHESSIFVFYIGKRKYRVTARNGEVTELSEINEDNRAYNPVIIRDLWENKLSEADFHICNTIANGAINFFNKVSDTMETVRVNFPNTWQNVMLQHFDDLHDKNEHNNFYGFLSELKIEDVILNMREMVLQKLERKNRR